MGASGVYGWWPESCGGRHLAREAVRMRRDDGHVREETFHVGAEEREVRPK